MSRWHQNFNNPTYKQSWELLKSLLSEATVDDISNSSDVEELVRLRKVIKYIDEISNVLDVELVPFSYWSKVNDQALELIEKLKAYKNSRDIENLKSANTNADNLLIYIRPYMIDPSKSAGAFRKAVVGSSETLHSDISRIGNRINNEVKKVEEDRAKSAKLLKDINDLYEKLSESSDVFFDDEDGIGYGTQAKNIVDEITVSLEESNKKIIEIEGNRKTSEIYKDETFSYLEEVNQLKNKISELLSSAENSISDLNKFYVKIFGNSDSENDFGLKVYLEERMEELAGIEKQQKQKFIDLEKDIRSHLPGAVSAGLATAYENMRKKFTVDMWISTAIFYSSLIALGYFSYWLLQKEFPQDWLGYVQLVVLKVPLATPIIWMAIFSSKRRAEAHRLQQEYAHKAVLASTYVSFKKQIENLGEGNDELLKELMSSAIEAVSYNASNTLDKPLTKLNTDEQKNLANNIVGLVKPHIDNLGK